MSKPYLEQHRFTDGVERDGLAITALAGGGDGNLPWLLALGADKLPPSRGAPVPAERASR